MDKKVILRYSVRETMGLLTMGVALFWSAGTLRWWPGWALIAVMLVWTIGMAAVILHFNPDLLRERLGPRKGAKSWDMAIISLLGIFQLARCILAGLDYRFGWTGGFPISAQFAGLAVCILGNSAVVWATASNAFFSQIVRLQPERGQAVATNGPYRFVRHPAYSGGILQELGVAALLGSVWIFIPAVLNILLFILRTALEDRTLQSGLAGYKEYAAHVQFRLLPRLW